MSSKRYPEEFRIEAVRQVMLVERPFLPVFRFQPTFRRDFTVA